MQKNAERDATFGTIPFGCEYLPDVNGGQSQRFVALFPSSSCSKCALTIFLVSVPAIIRSRRAAYGITVAYA
jgi:hypothetical protein